MIREQSRLLQQILFFSDLLCITLGWILGYYLRFEVLTFSPFELPLWRPLSRYLDYLPALLLIWAFGFAASGLYNPKVVERFYNMVYAVGRAVIWALGTAFIGMFFYRQFFFSRFHMFLFAACTSLLMILTRGVAYQFVRVGRIQGKNQKRVLILGAGKIGQRLAAAFKQYPWMGFEIVGFLDDDKNRDTRVIGNLDALADVTDAAEKEGKPIHYVYIALPLRVADKIEQLLDVLSSRLSHVYLVPDLMRFNLLNSRISDIEGMPLIHLIDETPMDIRRFIKRMLDIMGAIGALLVFSPIMFLLALGVKLSSKGPVFYKQERMSMNGQTFKMLKFRSMPMDSENKSGPVWAKSGENRATPLGSFMRRTSLDELPQFWNVLVGEMSLVGPRPERPFFIQQFKQHVPNYMLRHKAKAGITGWAQVNGFRGDTSIEKRIEYDLYYIQNWSLKLDFKIMLMTVWKGFRDENAY
jgi:exopolysaccharide biosynthesis polyprenyl glycosylphosphotransferase